MRGKQCRQVIAWLLFLTLCFTVIPAVRVSSARQAGLSTKRLTVTVGKGKTLKVNNTKKKVKWKILSGKKCIALKKKGKTAVIVNGRKKGTAQVQAVSGKKKLTCKVIVKSGKQSNTLAPGSKTPEPVTDILPVVTTPSQETTAPQGTITPQETTIPQETTAPHETQTPIPTSKPVPTATPLGSHEQDVEALKALIAGQRGRGATVSENVKNTDEYTWENGRLTKICWIDAKLTGGLDLSGLYALTEFACGNNQLSSLDVSNNTALNELYCYNNQLSSLDVSNNTALIKLNCISNQLDSLDVSKNTMLTGLMCDPNVTVTGYESVSNPIIPVVTVPPGQELPPMQTPMPMPTPPSEQASPPPPIPVS